jgi:hypothetical protein
MDVAENWGRGGGGAPGGSVKGAGKSILLIYKTSNMPSINMKLLNQTKGNSINNRACLKLGAAIMITRPRNKKKSFATVAQCLKQAYKMFALYSELQHAKNYPKPDILKTKSSLQ